MRARATIEGIDSYQILFKDLKVVEHSGYIIAVPGFPMLVRDYVKMDGATEQHVDRFAKELNCDCVVLMGMKIDDSGAVFRDLAVISVKDVAIGVSIVRSLEENAQLQLEQQPDIIFLDGVFYHQGNIKMSRKQIVPILQNIHF